jgi:hypothetical protein
MHDEDLRQSRDLAAIMPRAGGECNPTAPTICDSATSP